MLRRLGSYLATPFRHCPNCGVSYLHYRPDAHVPIPEEYRRCWLVAVPGSAEKSPWRGYTPQEDERRRKLLAVMWDRGMHPLQQPRGPRA